MLTVATVLKSGGDYRPEHVARLRDGVRKHLTEPHRFVCLTDLKVDCERIPLKHGWPGWWSKIELFSHKFGGPLLYMDLDTIPVGSLDRLGSGHRFTMLRNFWRVDRVGSGLMAWNVDLSAIYEEFKLCPQAYMSEFHRPDKWGDQAYILARTPVAPEFWQLKFPGRVVSYKMHCRPGTEPHDPNPKAPVVVPDGASLVCFHGQPRPWATPLWERAA